MNISSFLLIDNIGVYTMKGIILKMTVTDCEHLHGNNGVIMAFNLTL